MANVAEASAVAATPAPAEASAGAEAQAQPAPSGLPAENAAEKPAQPASEQSAQQQPSDTPAPPPQHQLTRDEICQMIGSAASGEDLPFEFFARLIWQESRFNPYAVSRAGAQGIAQFMLKTASGRGLADPFEPASALQESAEFLRELRQQFGNVGLAAAAYNAGPKRVQDWLAKRASLPRETQNYVEIITGRSAQTWAAQEVSAEESGSGFQCHEIAALVAQRRSTALVERLARLVLQRLNGAGADALAAGRSARNGILAKRAPRPVGAEQVAKAGAQARGRTERIIKIMAQGHARPRVQVVNVVARSGEPRRAGKAAEKARNVAEKATKVADAHKGAPEPQRHGKHGVQLAANLHGGGEKSCSQAKAGGRKTCRAV